MNIEFSKQVYEGWTVGDFIEELEPIFNMVMENRSYIKPFKTKEELKNWLKDNQPYYKKHVPGVYNYFIKKSKL